MSEAESVQAEAAHAPASSLGAAWSPLRLPYFRAVWLASTVSNIGTWMQSTSAAWMMTSLSTSPLMVALMQTATSLPFFLLALPAGALADVFDRRRVLLITQIWMLLAAALLGALTLAGLTTDWWLLGLTFALGIGGALTAPAFQAYMPNLVPRPELPAAVALGGVSFNLARAVGPAAGGLLVAWHGAGPVFLINAASFLAVVLVLATARSVPDPAGLPAERVVGAIRAGARFVRHSSPFHAVLVRGAAFMLPASALWALIPLVARNDLHMTAIGYGSLLGCLGLGAISGAWFLPWLRDRLSADRVLAGSTIVFAGVTAVLGTVRIVPAVGAAMFVGGVFWMSAMSTLNIAAQTAAPSWVRARVLAVSLLVVQGGLALGSVLWGTLAAHTSTNIAMQAGAATAVVGALLTWRFKLAGLEDLDLSPAVHWPHPELKTEIDPENVQVLVTVEYDIAPEDVTSFVAAMNELSETRRRDGAIEWDLFRDAANPTRFVETFRVTSWLEHLRQHQRVTASDRVLQDRVRAFHRGEQPRITHLLSLAD